MHAKPEFRAARFVLAYQYLTEGFSDDAIRQLKNVVALQPKDRLSAQLLQQLERKDQSPAGSQTAPTDALAQYGPGGAPAPAAAPPGSEATASAKPGNFIGSWTAQPAPDSTITLAFQDQGHFTWSVTRQAKSQVFNGTSTFDNGILTMVQDQNKNNVMVGNVTWKDDDHFTFKVLGAAPDDPGLAFTKTH